MDIQNHFYNQKGQSLVELAITITVIVFLLAGAFDFGSAFLDFIALRDAAQEGAVYGSIDPTNTSNIIARVRQSSNRPVDFSTYSSVNCSSDPNSICVTYQDNSHICSGYYISVYVSYEYNVLMPFFSGLTIPLHTTVTNTILNTKCPSP